MTRRFAVALAVVSLAGTFGVRTAGQGFEFGGAQQERKLVDRFDADGNKRLNTAERRAARTAMGDAGSRPWRRGAAPLTSAPGPRLGPTQVKMYRAEPVYDLGTLRTFVLGYVRDIADRWLDWTKLEPMAAQYQALIAADVKTDTRKLDSFEAFHRGIAGLKTFVDERRAYLLNWVE